MMIRYNRYKKDIIRLQEGEEFCKNCDGHGMIKSKRRYQSNGELYLVCKYCLGAGKIDWVERITGKTKNGT